MATIIQLSIYLIATLDVRFNIIKKEKKREKRKANKTKKMMWILGKNHLLVRADSLLLNVCNLCCLTDRLVSGFPHSGSSPYMVLLSGQWLPPGGDWFSSTLLVNGTASWREVWVWLSPLWQWPRHGTDFQAGIIHCEVCFSKQSTNPRQNP